MQHFQVCSGWVGLLSKCHDLPNQNTKSPHIWLASEHTIHQWFRGHPSVKTICAHVSVIVSKQFFSALGNDTKLLRLCMISDRWMKEHGAPVKWCWQGKTKVLWEKPVPVPLCSPQITHGLNWDYTWASAVRGWKLTAQAIAQPFSKHGSHTQ